MEVTDASSAPRVRCALWLYASLVAAVTAFSWGIYWHGHDFEKRPLYKVVQRFGDLADYFDKTLHLRHRAAELGSGFPVYNYPPPGAVVFRELLHAFPGHPISPYLIILGACVLGYAVVTWKASDPGRGLRLPAAVAILVTAELGYPLWITADRANTEGLVWALAAGGLCFLLRGKYRIAGVLIGLSASIKPFSILFLLLLLGRGKYKAAGLGVLTASTVIFAATLLLGPNPWKVYQGLKPNASYYVEHYVEAPMSVEEERFVHSLLDGMKSVALTVEMGGIRPHKAVGEVPKLIAEPGGWHVTHTLARIYPWVAVTGLGIVITVFYGMPILNQLTAIGVSVTLFPPVAADYTLLHLYVPFGAFLVFLTRDVAVGKVTFSYASMIALAVIYALLFAPLTFLMLYAGDAKLLLLLALLVVAAKSPMHSEYFDVQPARVKG
jgi:Glycosyltransferase family 87